MALEVYEKLINALVSFYEDAKAPSMLKSIVFTLLSRLLIKLRHLYRQQGSPKGLSEDQKREYHTKHFTRLFMKKEFIGTLLSELLVHKSQEEHVHQF